MFRRYVGPYKKYVASSLAFNVLSALLNVFSFASLIPMLKLLFNTEQTSIISCHGTRKAKHFPTLRSIMRTTTPRNSWLTTAPAPTLLMIGVFLVTATLLKTSCYFASVATMVPVRTGIVRDIREHALQQDHLTSPLFLQR